MREQRGRDAAALCCGWGKRPSEREAAGDSEPLILNPFSFFHQQNRQGPPSDRSGAGGDTTALGKQHLGSSPQTNEETNQPPD